MLPGAPDLAVTIVFMLVALAICAMVAWFVYRWVETPLLRSLSRRRAPAVALAARSSTRG